MRKMNRYVKLIIVNIVCGGSLVAVAAVEQGINTMHNSPLYWVGAGILVTTLYPIFRMRHGSPSSKASPKIKKTGTVGKLHLGTQETELDALYRLVQEKGKASVKMFAQQCGVEKSLVEEWAKILESHGLITLKYPTFGSPILLKKEEPKKEDDKKKEESKTPKGKTTKGTDTKKATAAAAKKTTSGKKSSKKASKKSHKETRTQRRKGHRKEKSGKKNKARRT